VLHDLSTALDTVDYAILSHWNLGTLKWLNNFLTNQSQSMVIHDSVSPKLPLQFGVPQVSLLGPILFTNYLLGLHDVILAHGISYMLSADDIQLYITLSIADLHSAIRHMEQCTNSNKRWLAANFLILNDTWELLKSFANIPLLSYMTINIMCLSMRIFASLE
jgi:hypothetical protein